MKVGGGVGFGSTLGGGFKLPSAYIGGGGTFKISKLLRMRGSTEYCLTVVYLSTGTTVGHISILYPFLGVFFSLQERLLASLQPQKETDFRDPRDARYAEPPIDFPSSFGLHTDFSSSFVAQLVPLGNLNRPFESRSQTLSFGSLFVP